MAKSLNDLFFFLDHLNGRAPLERLTSLLRDLDVDCEELTEYVLFSDRTYRRNLVRGGEWYNALVLCWKNGQRSPIHDHASSSCGVRVLRGTMTETLFEFAPHGHVKAVSSRDYPVGSVIGSQDDDLHQVSNLQEGDAALVTLHVYSPPLSLMGTYSITDLTRGSEPMILEFCDAAGI
jgi:cysteine dioxygenase